MRLFSVLLIFLLRLAVTDVAWPQTPAADAPAPQSVNAVRVAAISLVPKKFDLAGNANRLEQAFRAARQGEAQLAVAPEGVLEGYVVNEIIAGDALPRQMRAVAITMDDPLMLRFQRLARELEMCLVFGFAERTEDDVFNAAVFLDDTGRICGKYHKMQFAEGYDSRWWFNRLGQTSRAFDTPFGRCGILICNDRWNPQLARLPVLDGAQFLIIPSFGSRSLAQDQAVLARGQENGVPVIEANVGVTLVVNNNKIAAVDRQEEGITFADVHIPPPNPLQIVERGRLEREFLAWRETEMQARWQRTQQRLKEQRRAALEALQALGARIRRDGQGQVIEVNLQETKTRDTDLVHLRRLHMLRELSLHQTPVTATGLEHLRTLQNLRQLFLSETRTSDEGLAHLGELRNLRVLGLSGTQVTDAGLTHLERLTQLETLFLLDAPTTAAGAARLQQVLPDCDIIR